MSNEDNVIKKVALKVKELRGDITQKEFASMLGVSPQAVSEWENANKMPRMGIIEQLSIKYDVPKSYILGENNIKTTSRDIMQLELDGCEAMIGNKLRARRKELGLTLEEVGNIVGVGKSTVRKWETGYIENMKRDKIALLAKALQVSPAYIMGWENKSGEAFEEGDFVVSSGQVYEYDKLNPENRKKLDDYFRLLLNDQLKQEMGE